MNALLQNKKRRARKLSKLSALLILVLFQLSVFAGGMYVGFVRYQDAIYKDYKAQIDKAFAKGQESQAWISRLTHDKEFSTEFCHRWWFDLNPAERPIEPNRKLKNVTRSNARVSQ